MKSTIFLFVIFLGSFSSAQSMQFGPGFQYLTCVDANPVVSGTNYPVYIHVNWNTQQSGCNFSMGDYEPIGIPGMQFAAFAVTNGTGKWQNKGNEMEFNGSGNVKLSVLLGGSTVIRKGLLSGLVTTPNHTVIRVNNIKVHCVGN